MKSFPTIAFFSLGCLLAAPAHAKIYSAIPGESAITYKLVHKMHEVTGVSKNFKCVVDLAPDSLKSRIYVKSALSEFNSGNSSRDGNMFTVAEGDKYPNVEFSSDSVRRDNSDWKIYGKLYFHGVKRPAVFNVRPENSQGSVRIQGEFKVSLTEFNIERPRLLLIPVEDDIDIRLDVVAKTE